MIVIESKREGFRRAGLAHSVKPTTYPDDHFTAEQLEELRDEKMLMVSVIPTKEFITKKQIRDLVAEATQKVQAEPAKPQTKAAKGKTT